MNKPLLVLGLFALLLTGCGGAQGSQAESLALWPSHQTLPDLIAESDIIVRAQAERRLGEREFKLDPKQRSTVVFTDTELAVLNVLKGDAPERIVVAQAGREGDPALTFPELPLIRVGTVVLLFLHDATAEPLHGATGSRYTIVSPEGLYEVVGSLLVSAGPDVEVTRQARSLGLHGFEERILQNVR